MALDQLLHPTLDPKAPRDVLTKGLPASPGAASGAIAFDARKQKPRRAFSARRGPARWRAQCFWMSSGSLPPLAAISSTIFLCSQMFIAAESLASPV